MTPILGITASSITSSFLGSYESIATVTVTSTATAVEFASIPQTYKHLQIRGFYINTVAQLNDTLWRYNDDSNANYWNVHSLRGDGATATALGFNAGGNQNIIAPYGNSTSYFSAAVVDILDYTNTDKFKTFRSLNGHDLNGSGNVFLQSAHWRSTSAITKITITAAANSYNAGTHFALYGIKG